MAETSNTPELVLASSSPRRQQMLKGFGLEFTIDVANIDETPLKKELPRDYVRRVATLKAQTVASRHKGKVVIAGDTSVIIGRKIIGKPANKKEASEMVALIAGRRHKVISTICVVMVDGKLIEKTTTTVVKIRPMRKQDIERYVEDERNWRGIAGSYGIQTSSGGALIQSINGSPSGVAGLPLCETLNLLRRCGYAL